VVEATKASRILRTRGEIGRRFLFAALEWVGGVPDFFAAALVVFGEEGCFAGFDAGAAEESWGELAAGVAAAWGADDFSGTEPIAAGAAASCAVATAGENAPPKSEHTPANKTARQHLRPNRNTLLSIRAKARMPEPDSISQKPLPHILGSNSTRFVIESFPISSGH